MREIVGVINYISQVTRPDCAYCTNQLASVQNNPAIQHWRLAKQVLKYMSKDPEYGPTYHADGHVVADRDLCYYVDASFADVKPHDFSLADDGRRSCYGFVAFCAGGPVNWKSAMLPGKRSLSSTESELKAATMAARDCLQLRWLSAEMGHSYHSPTTVYEDNQSCICIILKEGLGTGERLKHVETNWFFARDCQQEKDCNFVKLGTEDMTADGLTKSLYRHLHETHSDKMVGKAYYSHDSVALCHDGLVNKPAFAVHQARHLPGVPSHHWERAQKHFCASLRITDCAATPPSLYNI